MVPESISSTNITVNPNPKHQSGPKSDPSLTTQFVTTEELAEVEKTYRAQRKLSFTYGSVFFAVTLLIPFLSGTAEWWYGKPFLFGFTFNLLTSLLLFYVFYWILALFFVKKANKLDDDLNRNK
ncbi:hypothetical protein AB6A23_09500 [Paenibacillus tarimensis]